MSAETHYTRSADADIAYQVLGDGPIDLVVVPFLQGGDFVADEIEQFLTGEKSSSETDRVLATVMFTDISGATNKAAELGDRAWRDLLQAHHGAIRRELQRFRGKEIDTAGDGFFAAFDGPARAVRCGKAAIESVRPFGLSIRVGVHTGKEKAASGAASG